MSAKLPDGSKLYLSTEYGAAKVIASITNANPAVMTLASGHSIVEADIFEVTSGWSEIDGAAFRADFVGSPAANDVELGALDSSDTSLFPAGEGVGTVREITTFVEIQQVLAFETTGGDPQKVPYKYLSERRERSLVSGSSAQDLQITIADDITKAGYLALKAASKANATRTVKLVLPDGSIVLYNGTVFMNETPIIANGAVNRVIATLSLGAAPVRY